MIVPESEFPSLVSEYPLTPEQIAQYQRDGHICLRGVLSPEEVAPFRTSIRAAVLRESAEVRPLKERDTYGKAFLQVMNLWTKEDGVQQFVRGRRLAQIASRLMGVDGVRLYHDQALFKEPGGGYTPWHQDQTYWPLETTHTITLWMPLVDVPADVGSMTFASGSHLRQWITDERISDASEAFFDQYIKTEQLKTVYYGAMRAGDATFHSGWTLHQAKGNPTETMREVMTVIYMEDGVKICTAETVSGREADLQWMPGCGLGELAASPLNPVLYSEADR
ncbi:MAG: phytanoyl-CoA dioxygenase family protein [Firmicutes bacterium]|jgi:ectoine hydroxylase-related dioxygenase (phytanoyl-CoA dioxygenase family)|nr:phytanoyl-CoA dioxygenase family protein [Bacillota bacterium]MCL5065576.1 phytanoyl-CoA dioxygenase family protein [Bacillota bacterium]